MPDAVNAWVQVKKSHFQRLSGESEQSIVQRQALCRLRNQTYGAGGAKFLSYPLQPFWFVESNFCDIVTDAIRQQSSICFG